jgi:predicted DNA-binding transcriptional regulator YafY
MDETFPKDHPFNPDLFWKNKFGLFSADQVEVKLQFSKEIRHHIEGRIWHHSQEINLEKNGSLVLSMKVGISPELIAWILGWNKHVKVLSPIKLIEEIQENVKEIQQLYDN